MKNKLINTEQRKQEILRLRVEENKSLNQIAEKIGVSRERIRQISRGIPNFPKRLPQPPKPLCIGCGINHPKNSQAKYCSRDCWVKNSPHKMPRRGTPEHRAYNTKRCVEYVRTHYRGTEKYRLMVQRNNKLFKQRNSDYYKVYMEKLKADPVRYANYLTRQREKYLRYKEKKLTT